MTTDNNNTLINNNNTLIQISQLEFRDEMCGDKALHTREIEAIYLELLGREPEPKGLSVLVCVCVCVCVCVFVCV